MARTIAERLAAGLAKHGYTEEAGRTSKYRTFVHPDPKRSKVFVGKSGGFRAGANSSTSFSIKDGLLYRQLLKDEA